MNSITSILGAGDISFLSALFFPVVDGGWSGFFASLALIPALLIGLNFSDKIKNANNELIDANPTSISNPIILKICLLYTSPSPRDLH